ncbi:MAG: GNAT family N-acetyltransferase [Flavobacteriaceae bacterium]
MLEVKKITQLELETFIKSETFSNFKNIPISSLRSASYVKNKHANAKDVILYMAFIDKELVGYRSIWRDVFYHGKVPESFGWLSGNWVHPKYRRKGVSTQLFNEVYKDWGGRLLYTNYAIPSKLLYDKTGYFKKIKSLKGVRFYTQFCLQDILPKKHVLFSKTTFLWKCLDAFGNMFWKLKTRRPQKNNDTDSLIKENEDWHHEIDLFLADFKNQELFKRGDAFFSWVLQYPWVKTGVTEAQEAKKYQFSVHSKQYKSTYYTFYDSDNKIIAFLWISLKDGHLKIQYAYLTQAAIEEVAAFIVAKSLQENVKTILVYQKELETILMHKLPHLYNKRFDQNYFATEKVIQDFPEISQKKIQPGDGDVIFT